MLPSMVELMKKGPSALKYYIPKANQCKHRKSIFSVKHKKNVWNEMFKALIHFIAAPS